MLPPLLVTNLHCHSRGPPQILLHCMELSRPLSLVLRHRCCQLRLPLTKLRRCLGRHHFYRLKTSLRCQPWLPCTAKTPRLVSHRLRLPSMRSLRSLLLCRVLSTKPHHLSQQRRSRPRGPRRVQLLHRLRSWPVRWNQRRWMHPSRPGAHMAQVILHLLATSRGLPLQQRHPRRRLPSWFCLLRPPLA